MKHKHLMPWWLAVVWGLLLAGSAAAGLLETAIDFSGFAGAGFAPEPAAGQLDSDLWGVTGLSEGDLAFGETGISGDFARGLSAGGVGGGGIYAFDRGSGDVLLGVQPTASDFTPGDFILRLPNEAGGPVNAVDVAYDIYVFNDQDRASSLNLAVSTDGVLFTPLPALDFTSPAEADPSPAWVRTGRSAQVVVDLPDQGFLYLRWTGDDAGGGGSRDELGLDNITVSGLEPAAVALSRQAASGVLPAGGTGWGVAVAILAGLTGAVRRSRRRAK